MRTIWIITVLLIGILLTFTACGSPATTPTIPEQTTGTTPPPLQGATPTTTIPKSELTLQIVSVTSPISPGANATLVAQTVPGADCDIDVYYKSGASTAQGLYPKTAGGDGRVSWTWKVGTRTTPGSWQIVVQASYGGETVTESTYFTVQ